MGIKPLHAFEQGGGDAQKRGDSSAQEMLTCEFDGRPPQSRSFKPGFLDSAAHVDLAVKDAT